MTDDRIFSTDIIRDIRDKYEVWECALCPADKYQNMLLWIFLEIFTIICIGNKSSKSLEIEGTRQSTDCSGRYNFGPQTTRDTNCIETVYRNCSEIALASPKKGLSIRHLAIASVCFSTSRDNKCLFLSLFSLSLLWSTKMSQLLLGWCGPPFSLLMLIMKWIRYSTDRRSNSNENFSFWPSGVWEYEDATNGSFNIFPNIKFETNSPT